MEVSFTMSMLALVATTLAAPTTLVARASTGCAEGEVGVDRTQLCNLGGPGPGSSRGQIGGEILPNDCGYIAGTVSTDSSGYCGATWSDGASVDCGDSESVTHVHTEGGDFGNGYQHSASCQVGPWAFYNVAYCCSRL
ncbi:hypothetical protein LTS10_005636 [Elasticomyces elasticus]|nr:hypothetical protein LTS10_005636 [Elasticomyces elasticus]